MKLKLTRTDFSDTSTIGSLYLDDVFQCYTLEDVVRVEKIPGQTAIPTGVYQVIIDYSNRFKRLMPLLVNVPSFSGIRIHSGNTDKDTEGCILVGNIKKLDFIGESRIAFGQLYMKLLKAYAAEKMSIEIMNGNGNKES